MTEDFESRLKRALRPVSPDEEFSARLVERVTVAARPPAPNADLPPRRAAMNWWLSAGLAASLLLGLGIQHRASESRERVAGLAARRQVLEALRVTNQKLDLAYHTVLLDSRDEP
jgi:hypothetical protein